LFPSRFPDPQIITSIITCNDDASAHDPVSFGRNKE
jgi:hypothetical protein